MKPPAAGNHPPKGAPHAPSTPPPVGHPTTPPPTRGPTALPPTAPLVPNGPFDPNKSAYDELSDFFGKLGMKFDSELNDLIQNAMKAGYGPDKINLIMPELEKTKAFQTRFPGYKQRIDNGYNAIDLGQYLQLEDSYHQKLQAAGLPAGFYDDPSDFGQFIANDVSVEELQTRISAAVTETKKIDPTSRELMAKFYGLSTGDIASYFLDPNRSLPVIERQFQTAQIAAHASRAGLDTSSATRYETLLDQGLTPDQAAQGYGTVKSLKDTVGASAAVYGDSYNQSDAEQDVFFNRSDKRRQIMSQESATFGGKSQGNTGSAQRQAY